MSMEKKANSVFNQAPQSFFTQANQNSVFN